MKHEIRYQPNYSLLTIDLEPGDAVVAEAGAMVTRNSTVAMETQAGGGGGIMGGLKRMIGGESLFRNTFTAPAGGEVTLAPALVGDIAHVELASPTEIMLQSGSYLASEPSVEIDLKWQGAKGFFGGEGLVLLKLSGEGSLWFNAFGAIQQLDVTSPITIDTGHIVAFESTLDYKVRRFGGGWKSFLLSGEGFVAEFEGHGKLWIQTRNPSDYGGWLGAKLPPRKN